LNATIKSPFLSPSFAAGPPGCTASTSAPMGMRFAASAPFTNAPRVGLEAP
jgi:hypothetical protein